MGATYGIYLGMAAAACLFAALAERAREKTYTLCRVTLAGQEHACRVSAASFWLVFAAIPLILVSGLRWGIGVDAQNYFWMFTNIHYNLANHAEVGFYLLCQLVWYFTEDMSILFLLCAGITVAFVMLAIRQSSRNMLMSVFLYMGMGYFFYSLNSMRHFMAIAIFLYAYKHIRAGQFWRYAGWILLAASFQKVALVALPLYFILRIRWKCYWYAIAGGLLVLAAVLHRPLLDFAYRHGFGFYQAIEAETSGWSAVNILITLGLSVLAFLYRKQLLERDPGNIILINAAWCGFLYFTTSGWIPEYTRIGQYLTVLALFLAPELIACEAGSELGHRRLRLLYTIGVYTAFTAYMLLIIWNAQAPTIGWAPYQSVFQRTEYYKDLVPFWTLA